MTRWNVAARLLCTWNIPGKNTGVGSHFLSQESSRPRDWIQVSCIAGRFFTIWATREGIWCREPAWRTLPTAKVMRKEARHTQRWDRASGVPLEILEHLPPKAESAYFTALCSHLHLWLYRGLSPTTSLWKRVNLQLQLIKFLGVTRMFQPTNSSEVSSSTCDCSQPPNRERHEML